MPPRVGRERIRGFRHQISGGSVQRISTGLGGRTEGWCSRVSAAAASRSSSGQPSTYSITIPRAETKPAPNSNHRESFPLATAPAESASVQHPMPNHTLCQNVMFEKKRVSRDGAPPASRSSCTVRKY